MIVAESYRRAREAVQLVKVTYDVSKAPKPVLSLDEAISRNSFFPPYPGTTPVGPFTTGDLSKGFAQSKHVLQVPNYFLFFSNILFTIYCLFITIFLFLIF